MSFAPISKLATGAFTAGPKDELATADIYKLTSSSGSTINSIQSAVGKLETSIFGNVGKELEDFMSSVGGEIKFDPKILSERIMGTSSELKNSFRELTGDMQNSALVETFKDKTNDLMCKIDDYKSMASKANVTEVRALGNFINQYTGTKIFSSSDKGALGGLLGSVVGKASDLGVTGVFTNLTKTITDNGLISKIVKVALPLAAKNSDFKLLREMSSSPAGRLINVFSPGFTSNMSRMYSQTSYSGRNTFNTYDDMLTSFSNINDQWDMLQRGEDNVALNLVSLLGGSKDFQRLLLAGVSYYANKPETKSKREYALATIYKKRTVYEDIKRYFPTTVIMDLQRPVYTQPRVEVKPAKMLAQALNTLFS